MFVNKKKVYRFALYGLSGSGKTCVLTALAMPRYSHPLGYSCLWNTIDASDNPLVERSQNWMVEAIHKLEEQELPPSNPIGEEFIFEYDFTASTHQTFRIELVDYSGDLINPNINHSAVAKKLRQKFKNLDGILVLADAPFQEQAEHVQTYCGKQAFADLHSLEHAFSFLRNETLKNETALDIPIALLITKWDRFSDIDYENPTIEDGKLEELFTSKPHPPHKGLSDVLRFSVSEDNFKTFPVSALGATECVQLDSGKFVERPIQVNPINTFGLENAFLWLAQRCDALDLQQFKDKKLKHYKQTGVDLLSRFPKVSEEAKQIHTLLQESQKAKKRYTIYTMMSIIILWFVAETMIDLKHYRQYNLGETATVSQLSQAEHWFTQYIAASDFRHFFSKFFLNREDAQSTLIHLQAHRDKSLWEPIEKALKVNLQAAFMPALNYIKHNPYGQHAQEALEIKLQAELQQQHWENKKAFLQIESEVQKKTLNIKTLNKFVEALRHIPLHPQSETPELQRQRFALEKKLLEQLLDLTKKQKWTLFRKNYDQHMLDRDFLAAAHLLTHRQSDTQLNHLKKIFQTDVILDIEQHVIHALKEEHYLEAYTLVKQYEKLPSELQNAKGMRKFTILLIKVTELRDESLYQAVLQHKTASHIMRYLQEAPLQTMFKEVSAYKREYLDLLEQNAVQQLALKLAQIRWVNVSDYDNIVTIYLDAKQIIYNNKVDAKPNMSTDVIGVGDFNAKYDDFITIEMRIINQDMFFDDDYGKGKIEKKLSELSYAFNLPLFDELGVKTATAFFEIEGYPRPPELPAWRNK